MDSATAEQIVFSIRQGQHRDIALHAGTGASADPGRRLENIAQILSACRQDGLGRYTATIVRGLLDRFSTRLHKLQALVHGGPLAMVWMSVLKFHYSHRPFRMGNQV